MPTPSQVANRVQPARPVRHYTGTVTAAGPPVVIALDPGGASTTARPARDATFVAGDRVLVLVCTAGNFVIMKL